MTFKNIHSDFRLNGASYTIDELKEVAYSLVKEGEPFERFIGDFLLDWLDDKSTVEVQTSGSTGKPKKIKLLKQHMLNSAKATGEFFKLEPNCTALLCLPANFIAGKMMLVRAMLLGLRLDYVAPSLNTLERNALHYDFCAMVPLQLERSLNKLHRIKTLIVGGAPIPYKVQAQVWDKVQDTQIFETYGMTETITHVAVKRLNNVGLGAIGAIKGTTANNGSNLFFKTLPNIRLSKDNRNCLVIDAPKVANAPVITNDIIKLISETEFEWLGRYDNVINSGGVKLFPEQIEKKLAPLIKRRFFVTGLPDEKLGQKLVLVVEGDIGKHQLLHEIKALQIMSGFEIPKEVYGVSRFYETENGKTRRAETLRLIQC